MSESSIDLQNLKWFSTLHNSTTVKAYTNWSSKIFLTLFHKLKTLRAQVEWVIAYAIINWQQKYPCHHMSWILTLTLKLAVKATGECLGSAHSTSKLNVNYSLHYLYAFYWLQCVFVLANKFEAFSITFLTIEWVIHWSSTPGTALIPGQP